MSASRRWPAIRPAVQALQDLGMHRKVQLIVSGGIRNGADVAKALALGADAVSIGTAALVALGDNDPASRSRIPRSSAPTRRRLRRLARGPRSGRHHHAGPGAAAAARSGAARTPARQLPLGHDAGGADHRAGLRQEPRPQSRARRSRGADRRGRGHGAACRSPAPTGFRARQRSSGQAPLMSRRRTNPIGQQTVEGDEHGHRSRQSSPKSAASSTS